LHDIRRSFQEKRCKELEKILTNLTQEEKNNFLTSIEMVAQLLTKARRAREGRSPKEETI
jgi:hypothetical protein